MKPKNIGVLFGECRVIMSLGYLKHALRFTNLELKYKINDKNGLNQSVLFVIDTTMMSYNSAKGLKSWHVE